MEERNESTEVIRGEVGATLWWILSLDDIHALANSPDWDWLKEREHSPRVLAVLKTFLFDDMRTTSWLIVRHALEIPDRQLN